MRRTARSARRGRSHYGGVILDVDEASAAALRTGDGATIVARQTGRARRRRLDPEREVIELARRGEAIPADGLLTPSARDRARALGLRVP